MNQMKQFKQDRRSPDSLLILLLLCIFALCSLVLVIFGANIYNSISEQRTSSFQLTTPLSYTSSKVRAADGADSIRLEEKEGATALILTTIDGGEPCETWIYTYDNNLCEIYVGQGASFSLSDGSPILRDCSLDYTLENGLLTMTSTDSEGKTMEMTVAAGGDSYE